MKFLSKASVLSMLKSSSWFARAFPSSLFGAGLPLQVPKSDLRVFLFGVFRHAEKRPTGRTFWGTQTLQAVGGRPGEQRKKKIGCLFFEANFGHVFERLLGAKRLHFGGQNEGRF